MVKIAVSHVCKTPGAGTGGLVASFLRGGIYSSVDWALVA